MRQNYQAKPKPEKKKPIAYCEWGCIDGLHGDMLNEATMKIRPGACTACDCKRFNERAPNE